MIFAGYWEVLGTLVNNGLLSENLLFDMFGIQWQKDEVTGQAKENKELWCFVASVDPDYWSRLFDVELRLGNERGSLATATRILSEKGISIVVGESHTYLCQVRAEAHLTLWFAKFQGDVDDLNKVFEDAVKQDKDLRKKIKPVVTTADRETWVVGKPSELTNYAFKKVFAPGTAGKPGEDNPIPLAHKERWATVREGKVTIPKAIIKQLNTSFSLPNKQFKSILGTSYIIMEADSDTKALKLTFPPPDARIVTVEFLTYDQPGSIAAIGKMLAEDVKINLLQTKTKSLSFAEEAVWAIIADVKNSEYEKLFPESALAEQMKKDIKRFIKDSDTIVKDIKVLFHPTMPESLDAPFSMLLELETKLRTRLERELSREFGSDWWKECIPQDVILTVSERKASEIRQFMEPRRNIEYLDFSDYIKIIAKGQNWEKVFKRIFPNKDSITTKLSELIPIRNKIAHATQLNEDEFQKLHLFCKEINKLLEKK